MLAGCDSHKQKQDTCGLTETRRMLGAGALHTARPQACSASVTLEAHSAQIAVRGDAWGHGSSPQLCAAPTGCHLLSDHASTQAWQLQQGLGPRKSLCPV